MSILFLSIPLLFTFCNYNNMSKAKCTSIQEVMFKNFTYHIKNNENHPQVIQLQAKDLNIKKKKCDENSLSEKNSKNIILFLTEEDIFNIKYLKKGNIFIGMAHKKYIKKDLTFKSRYVWKDFLFPYDRYCERLPNEIQKLNLKPKWSIGNTKRENIIITEESLESSSKLYICNFKLINDDIFYYLEDRKNKKTYPLCLLTSINGIFSNKYLCFKKYPKCSNILNFEILSEKALLVQSYNSSTNPKMIELVKDCSSSLYHEKKFKDSELQKQNIDFSVIYNFPKEIKFKSSYIKGYFKTDLKQI